jgi:hypothetical protein
MKAKKRLWNHGCTQMNTDERREEKSDRGHVNGV